MNTSPRQANAYELRFLGLFNSGRGYAFPCDAAGHVDIDTLREPARTNYFYARSVIGREFHSPVTCPLAVTRQSDESVVQRSIGEVDPQTDDALAYPPHS